MAARIHIVGGPGSGKTTLATRLGHLLAAPVHDLHTVAYETGAGRKRELALRPRMFSASAVGRPG
jgi:adenylate kinase family enzyme